MSTTVVSSLLTPILAGAVTYTQNGAAVLANETVSESKNILAAAGLANFNLTCLLLLSLMIAGTYLFHIIWHPKRQHELMSERERQAGSMRFYIGGTIVWMLISVMAETWCVLIPLALIFTGSLIHYTLHKAQLV